MNKQLIAVVFLLSLVACMATVFTTVRAQTYTPGVGFGDDYVFQTYSYWTSSDAYASIPQDLVTANQTTEIDVRISDVNTTFVTTFTATYYTNADPYAARGTVNVQTGDITDEGWPAIIAANLTSGEVIHPSGTDGITINDTVTMNSRPTNEINISFYNSTDGTTSSDDRFFDQATGMLVEEVQKTVDDGSISGTTAVYQLTMLLESSPWNPVSLPPPTYTTPEFPPILALPIFIGATTLIVIALKKKHLIVGTPAIKA